MNPETNSTNKSQKHKVLRCPACGSTVRIPTFWVVGIEGVFRCKECRFVFKTGYKMGAVLSAIGLCLSILTAQILLYVLSVKAIPIAIAIIIPLWITYGYTMRKAYMIRKCKRSAKKLKLAAIQMQQPPAQNSEQQHAPDNRDDILNTPLESDPTI